MTADTEPRRSRRGLLIVALGGVIAAVAAAAVAAAITRLKRHDGTHVTMGVTIDRPVDEVFAFVSDARNVLEWLPAAGERRKLTDGPIGMGTTFKATDHLAGRTIEHTQEIIAFEQDRLVTTRLSAPWNGDYEIRVESVDGGTLLTINISGRPSGPYRWVSLVPASLMQKQFEQDYVRLKDLLEARAEQARPPADAVAVEIDTGKAPAAIAIEPEGESVAPAPEKARLN